MGLDSNEFFGLSPMGQAFCQAMKRPDVALVLGTALEFVVQAQVCSIDVFGFFIVSLL